MSDPRIDLVRTELATVQDPDLHKDLVTLNMIRDLEIDGNTAKFRLVLTTPSCPVKDKLEEEARQAALRVTGIDNVDITMDAEVPKHLQERESNLPGVRHVIAISSGKGGVGKSTVTANIACALAKTGARVGLLDADIYGPSMPTMMGVKREPYVANKKMIPVENHGVRIISIGFLVSEKEAMIWRGPMLMGAVRQFIVDVEWGELDYLLIDMPPGTGDVQMTLAQNAQITGAVIVSTPQSVALLDAVRGKVMFDKLQVKTMGMIENMSTFICPKCNHAEPIFGEGGAQSVAEEFDVPFLGCIPLEPAVRAAGDGGKPVVLAHPESASAKALTAVAQEVARQASIQAFAKADADAEAAPAESGSEA